jgi:hypothetical protein
MAQQMVTSFAMVGRLFPSVSAQHGCFFGNELAVGAWDLADGYVYQTDLTLLCSFTESNKRSSIQVL